MRTIGLILVLGLLAGCNRHYSEAECERVVQANQAMSSALSDAEEALSPSQRLLSHDQSMKACLKAPRDKEYARCLKAANGDSSAVARCFSDRLNRH
jgi:hypothetical protein